MIKAILIPTENVEEAWKLVDKHIQQALERSGDHFSSSDIKTNCLEESMQLWLGWDKNLDESHYCTAITQILKRPKKT